MTTPNPQGLVVGDLVKLTGENWRPSMRGTEVRISYIDDAGYPRFASDGFDDWVADESPEWAVERVLTPAGLRISVTEVTDDGNGVYVTGILPEGFKLDQLGDFSVSEDLVNHPSHYKTESGLEAIDVMEAFNLHRDGRLFNAGKYVLRAGQKDLESQDIRKAIWYLERYAADLEARGE